MPSWFIITHHHPTSDREPESISITSNGASCYPDVKTPHGPPISRVVPSPLSGQWWTHWAHYAGTIPFWEARERHGDARSSLGITSPGLLLNEHAKIGDGSRHWQRVSLQKAVLGKSLGIGNCINWYCWMVDNIFCNGEWLTIMINIYVCWLSRADGDPIGLLGTIPMNRGNGDLQRYWPCTMWAIAVALGIEIRKPMRPEWITCAGCVVRPNPVFSGLFIKYMIRCQGPYTYMSLQLSACDPQTFFVWNDASQHFRRETPLLHGDQTSGQPSGNLGTSSACLS